MNNLVERPLVLLHSQSCPGFAVLRVIMKTIKRIFLGSVSRFWGPGIKSLISVCSLQQIISYNNHHSAFVEPSLGQAVIILKTPVL